MNTGISGRIARAFIHSRLTPLIVIASLLLGLFAVFVTAREEEPQIKVPMIDVFVAYPGASAKEVEERVTTPMEKLLWEIEGIEYVYSMASAGGNLTIVRFFVGTDMEEAIVRLQNKLMSNYDRIPPGVSQPLVKPKSIDDVPVLALTLWSERYTGFELRSVATVLADELKKDENVSEVTVTGGQRRQVKVELDPARLRAYAQSPFQIIGALKQANASLPSGAMQSANTELLVEAGGFLKNADDVKSVVVGVHDGRPVYLDDVAKVTDGPEEPSSYVFMGLGPAAREKSITASNPAADFEAVTIALSKKAGANASVVAGKALEKVEALKGRAVPSGVTITTTRNYGETAREKSDELLEHMLIATIAVIVLVALVLGTRESSVVAVAVPVTLALTLLVNYLYGYTLNRVTLFALIFSIGILVDDAIVVVENIHRHFKMKGAGTDTAVAAVDEVGNPTILATFTVIAALLPMAFVSGLMGPYMRPIPVGAAAAMLFSLLVAFIVSPWLGYKVLKNVKHDSAGMEESSRLNTLYSRLLTPLIESRGKRLAAFGGVIVLLLLACLLVPLKAVTMKMLPFDNKSELQIVVDMDEGATLEETARATKALGEYLRTVPEVTDFQSYIGGASPYNFNGLVRHYYLRQGPNMADIQANFVAKDKRSSQSHDIAKRLRPGFEEIAKKHGAKIKLAEIPPGPPVLSTLVAEVYGPTEEGRIEVARKIKRVFETTPGVVDIDWYVEESQKKLVFEVDRTKASLSGVSTEAVAANLRTAVSGMSAGLIHADYAKDPVEIFLRMPIGQRTDLSVLKSIGVPSATGKLVPLSELVEVKDASSDRTIYHKNLKAVTYVTGDVAGVAESPVYAILDMGSKIAELKAPEGYAIEQFSATQPWLEDKYSMKWDGEWHITYEVFRDLGIAFAAVLVLIYILVVAWFRSFITPLVIMAPIPMTLVGILPGHWVFGAFFTATSMIGFIALAGIIVRNSILLVDFIEREQEAGTALKDAVVKAGAVRTRPILLTAAAVVVGSFVMLFDPIFQGLAISMMFGAVAATFLTLAAVPLLYYEFFRKTGR
jgi:multidrug efflux pump subunit AcrB